MQGQNCNHRGRKIQKFSGGEYPRPPPTYFKCDTTPNFLLPTNHLSFLYARYSMVPFCRWPPPTDEFLKKCPDENLRGVLNRLQDNNAKLNGEKCPFRQHQVVASFERTLSASGVQADPVAAPGGGKGGQMPPPPQLFFAPPILPPLKKMY